MYLFYLLDRELTDARLLKLSHKINREEELHTLVVGGLGMTFETVDIHLANKKDSITMATINVLKDWRKRQPDQPVAYRNMCDGLKKADMNSLIHEALQ